jgi:HSP20 family protein
MAARLSLPPLNASGGLGRPLKILEDHMSETDKKTPAVSRGSSSLSEFSRDWDPFANLHKEFDQLFGALRGGFLRSPFGSGSDLDPYWRRAAGQGATPAVDIVETDDHYELTAELPGLDPEQIDVKLADGRLTIKGEKREEKEEKKEGYYLSERRFGSFQRSFAVPDGIDPDKVSADFANGLLKITLPKSPELQQKEKKIAIKSR